MRLILLFLLVSLSRPLAAQQADSLVLEYYPGGGVKSSGCYRNGEREGKWFFYYENGKVWSEGYFVSGLCEGKGITWYDSGKKASKGNYVHGKAVGTWIYYAEDSGKKSCFDLGDGSQPPKAIHRRGFLRKE